MNNQTPLSADTQRAKIKRLLMDGKSITSKDAWLSNDLRIYCARLAARISELKNQEGLPICKTMERNEITGKRYARYWLPMSYINEQNRIFK